MEVLKFSYKLWLSIGGKPVIGPGGVEILRAIERLGSISRASRELNMSYRFIWGYLRRVERELGLTIVESFRGGRGGGGTKLTREGRVILRALEDADAKFKELAKNLTVELNSKIVNL